MTGIAYVTIKIWSSAEIAFQMHNTEIRKVYFMHCVPGCDKHIAAAV